MTMMYEHQYKVCPSVYDRCVIEPLDNLRKLWLYHWIQMHTFVDGNMYIQSSDHSLFHIHNSLRHHRNIQHCWSHHCKTCFQSKHSYHQRHQDRHILNNGLLQHMAHSNLHHHSCSQHCWSHHHRIHLRQQREWNQQYSFLYNDICNQNSDLCLCWNSNHRHRSCSLHCWSGHHRIHLQLKNLLY